MESKNQIELIKTEAVSLPSQAEEIVITDEISLCTANDFLQGCKKIRNKISELMDPIIKREYRAWKGTIADKQTLEEPLIRAEGIVKPKVASFKRKLEEEIRQKEEEIRAKIEAERRKQELLLKKAADLEKAGELEEADEKFEKAEAAEEKVKETLQNMAGILEAPKLAGTTIRRIPKWKLINLKKVPRRWLMLDEVKVGTAVRASKATIKIEGIEVYLEDSVATRG